LIHRFQIWPHILLMISHPVMKQIHWQFVSILYEAISTIHCKIERRGNHLRLKSDKWKWIGMQIIKAGFSSWYYSTNRTLIAGVSTITTPDNNSIIICFEMDCSILKRFQRVLVFLNIFNNFLSPERPIIHIYVINNHNNIDKCDG
jgi:hypothetical protein